MFLDHVDLNGTTLRLTLAEGRISAICPLPGPATRTAIPLPVAPQVHLDKAFTIHRAQTGKPGLRSVQCRGWRASGHRAPVTAG